LLLLTGVCLYSSPFALLIQIPQGGSPFYGAAFPVIACFTYAATKASFQYHLKSQVTKTPQSQEKQYICGLPFSASVALLHAFNHLGTKNSGFAIVRVITVYFKHDVEATALFSHNCVAMAGQRQQTAINSHLKLMCLECSAQAVVCAINVS